MAHQVRSAEYFKLEVPDKHGEAVRALNVLRGAGINLLAFHGFPLRKKSQLDLVPEDGAKLKALAKRAGWKMGAAKTCFLVYGDDRAGALADALGQLGKARVNIVASSGVIAGEGRFGAIVWVAPRDVKKAAKAFGIA